MSRSARRPAARTVHPRVTAAAAVVLSAGLLAACGTSGSTGSDGSDSSVPTSSATEESTGSSTDPVAPFTADNCGTEVSVAEPPQRIVAIKSAMTELVLALGAGDRLVAVAYQDGPASGPGAEQVAELPVLADRVPTNEAVLSVEPDLVLAGWESNFSADGAGERNSFAALDVATFVAPSSCTTAPYRPDPLTFEDVFAEITQVGDLLGTSEAAEALVTEQSERLELLRTERADAGASSEEVTALWWSSGSDTPYVGAGTGAPQMIMAEAGLTNIAGELDGGWGPYSWEAAVDADPDVIVLVDSSWNSAETKKETLAANPVTAALTAVREERYLVVPFSATEGGVRNVEAVRILTDQLAQLDSSGTGGA